MANEVEVFAMKVPGTHLLIFDFKPKLTKFNKFRIQKAAFMLNIFSDTDYFKFDKYHYGPYAHSIDILIKDINEYQKYYNVKNGDAYKLMTKSIVSEKTLSQYSKYSQYIEKSAIFINSIKSDSELELMTSILYLLKNEDLNSTLIEERIKSWTDRKAELFNKDLIDNAINELLDYPLIQVDLEGKYSLIN